MRASEFITEAWSAKYKRSINCSNPKGFSQKAQCQGRNKHEEVELEERKKKRKKIRHAAYGPGPYGMYGVDTGYSGDGGGIGESQKKGPAGQLKARDKVDVKGTVLGSPEKSQKGLRGKLVGGAMEDYDPNDAPPGPETKPTMPAGTVRVDVDDVYDWYKLGQHISNMKGLGKHDFGKGPPSTIFAFGSEDEEHKYINALKKTGLTTTDIDPVDPRQPKGMKRQKVDPTYNVDENFADGKNPGRKGLAKRSGVNCKASVSTLRNVAKNSSGEKQRMAHWCANMKSGKKK